MWAAQHAGGSGTAHLDGMLGNTHPGPVNLVVISGLAAPLLGWVDALQVWLPGGAAGSLVASLGARDDTPGVAELAGPTQVTLTLTAYLLVFAVAAGVLLRRRDI